MTRTARDVIHEWGVGDDRSVEDRTETDSLIARLDASGFVIVPKEPTDPMVDAGDLASDLDPEFDCSVRYIYRAMVAEATKDRTPPR